MAISPAHFNRLDSYGQVARFVCETAGKMTVNKLCKLGK